MTLQLSRTVTAATNRPNPATERPNPAVPEYDQVPSDERHDALVDALADLVDGAASGLAASGLAARLVELESGAEGAGSAAGDVRARVGVFHRLLTQDNTMPFVVPGYRQDADRVVRLEGLDRGQILGQLPRHPFFNSQAFGGRTVSLPLERTDEMRGALVWEPRRAPGFDLPRGLGGRQPFDDYAGKPVLVVFFLGFG